MKTPLLLLLAGICGLACGAPPPLPPLTQPANQAYLPGKLVWADLFTSDPAKEAQFYADLFGWEIEPLGQGKQSYILLRHEGRAIAGISPGPTDAPPTGGARWIPFMSVDDLPRASTLVQANGGRLLVPPRALPDRGTAAIMADRDGTLIGLLHSSSGDPLDRLPRDGNWVWATFFVRDVQVAAPFYRELFGYTVTEDERTAATDDYVLSHDGLPRAGLAPLPPNAPHARPGCLGFVQVADVATSVRRAIALGGRVLVEPRTIADGHAIAIISDPLGAAVALTNQPADQGEQ